jgi:uncharacterized protein YjbI with pentapeptide repeats
MKHRKKRRVLTVDPSLWTTLLKGVRAWNKMRDTVAPWQIDLSQINFSAASPKGANVEDPYDFYFDGLNCAEVSLRESVLNDGSFRGASFAKADLSYASVARASLKSADLRGAKLIGTTFLSTDLRDADFSGAEVGDTAFLRVDLSELRGIEASQHRFHSIIDTRTLEVTADKLRASEESARSLMLQRVTAFINKCGVPEPFVSVFRAISDP